MGISLHKDTDFTLTAYSDSDWAGCGSTRRSTGGYNTFMGKNLISWSSRKQPTVSKSSTEAEYRTLSETASEVTWLCSIFRELGLPLLTTPLLLCDNLSAVLLSANPSFHSRTKHFALDYHYFRERVALGAIEVKHIPNHLQIADIFTKSLPQAAFSSLRDKLGVDVLGADKLDVDSQSHPSLRGPIRESPLVSLSGPDQSEPNAKHSSLKPNTEQRSSAKVLEQDKLYGKQKMSTAQLVPVHNRFQPFNTEDS